MSSGHWRYTVTPGYPCPCEGCTREQKRPGCHDHCLDYKAWRKEVDRIAAARREYERKPFSKIL